MMRSDCESVQLLIVASAQNSLKLKTYSFLQREFLEREREMEVAVVLSPSSCSYTRRPQQQTLDHYPPSSSSTSTLHLPPFKVSLCYKYIIYLISNLNSSSLGHRIFILISIFAGFQVFRHPDIAFAEWESGAVELIADSISIRFPPAR